MSSRRWCLIALPPDPRSRDFRRRSGIAWINVSGDRAGGAAVAATTILKLVPLIIFIVIGAAFVHPANFRRDVHPEAQEFGRALILGMFAYIGMETPLCASGEVYRPSQTIPRALALTMVFTTALYVLIQTVAQGILGPSLASSKAPLADAMAQVHPLLRALMLAGGAISMFGYIGSDLLGSPRQLFAFARDGLLPAFLGRLHPRSHAPYAAILLYAVIAMLLAFTGTFRRARRVVGTRHLPDLHRRLPGGMGTRPARHRAGGAAVEFPLSRGRRRPGDGQHAGARGLGYPPGNPRGSRADRAQRPDLPHPVALCAGANIKRSARAATHFSTMTSLIWITGVRSV